MIMIMQRMPIFCSIYNLLLKCLRVVQLFSMGKRTCSSSSSIFYHRFGLLDNSLIYHKCIDLVKIGEIVEIIHMTLILLFSNTVQLFFFYSFFLCTVAYL